MYQNMLFIVNTVNKNTADTDLYTAKLISAFAIVLMLVFFKVLASVPKNSFRKESK